MENDVNITESVQGATPLQGASVDALAPVPDSIPEQQTTPRLNLPIEDSVPIADTQEPVKRPRGRPRKDGTVGDTVSRLNSTTQAAPRPVQAAPVAFLPPVDYEKPARIAANMWFNFGELVFGHEWQPEQSEVAPVKDSFKDYFEAEKIGHIPPSWGLALTLLAYTAKRVNRPSVKERIFGAFEWIKSKVKR